MTLLKEKVCAYAANEKDMVIQSLYIYPVTWLLGSDPFQCSECSG